MYGTLYGNSALSRALANSLVIGAIAATAPRSAGITVSYMDLYGRSPLAATISAMARLPILIPGVIVGISLLILVNLVGFGPSRIAIVLGHILVALPTTVVVMRSRFAAHPQDHPRGRARSRRVRLDDIQAGHAAAQPAGNSLSLHAGLPDLLRRVHRCLLLAGTEPTLPLYIWAQLRFPKSLPTVMALGTSILAVSFVIASIAEFLRHRGLAAARRPAPANPSKPGETERGELQWHST